MPQGPVGMASAASLFPGKAAGDSGEKRREDLTKGTFCRLLLAVLCKEKVENPSFIMKNV